MIQLIRILETEYGDPGIILVRGVYEDPSDYISSAKGAEAQFAARQTLSLPGSTRLALLDIATLRDSDDGPGYYAAVAGFSPAWHGASIYLSTNGGVDYAPLVSLTVPAAMGFAVGVLPAGPTELWDEVNTVDVDLINEEELFSETEANVLNGANLIALGEELILPQNAEQLSARRWRLSRFVRGVKGTEWAIARHRRGESFVALTPAAIRRVEDELSAIGVERHYRAPSIGTSIEDALTKLFTNTGVSLKPWAPVDIEATFDGGDNIVGTFRRRSRLQGRNGRDFYDPPLGEATESYEIDIMSDDELTVHRTLFVTSEAFFYSDAQQIEDFGGLKAFNLHLNIYQISAAVGRGYPGHAVINPGGVAEGGAFAFYFQDGELMTFEDNEAFLFEH